MSIKWLYKHYIVEIAYKIYNNLPVFKQHPAFRLKGHLAFPSIDLFTHQEMDDETKSSSERIVLEPYKYLLQLPGKFVVFRLFESSQNFRIQSRPA